MQIGDHLFRARKSSGLSQEAVAEKLGVSRQTISKWETNETLPDIEQSGRLAQLYHVSLDELTAFDVDIKEIERVIENTSAEKQKEIDWTALWAKQYPVLGTYQQEVCIEDYAVPLRGLLKQLIKEYHYSAEDAMLVLKDILAKVWNDEQ